MCEAEKVVANAPGTPTVDRGSMRRKQVFLFSSRIFITYFIKRNKAFTIVFFPMNLHFQEGFQDRIDDINETDEKPNLSDSDIEEYINNRLRE